MFGASVAFVYVLTGITGNLARTKKLPALYRIVSQLVRENRLGRCRIIGVGSRPKQIAEFRMLVYNACKEHVREFSEHFFSQVLWPLFQYHALDLRDQAAYCRFREIAELARGASRSARLVIDVSVLPELYQCFCEGFRGTLESFGPVDDLTTVLFEKPIGEDRRSAAELLKLMHQVFGAAHAKTWDHFLGKEGFRSMLQHRFSTLEIKRRWNSHHVRRINLSITETNGLEGRVYFARTGICRDMVCNHGAAYLSGLVMPEPRTHHPGDIQAALLEGARSFVPVDPACCNLGYYVRNDESNLPGYPEELAGLGLDAQQLARALSLGTSFAGTLVSRAPAWRNSRYFRLPTGITASGTGFSIEVIKRAPAAKKQVEVCFDRGKENLGMDRLVYHLEPG
ncbi:MAG TPA: hypothetical protein PLP17_00280, partial [Oligoflexia bacterium]|nr:hypothetical protein [Oligoflexia bacterium]